MQKLLSLRDQVKGAVVEFLGDEGMSCLKTQDGLVTLINKLVHYKEEGRALFPQIFIFDDLQSVLSMMPGSEHVLIGTGPKDESVMARALKKCAPLARQGWSMYIERRPDAFAYGVLRCGATLLSLSAADLLVDKGDKAVPVLVLRQVGEDAIEVKGVSQSSLLVYFGATREQEASPIPALSDFVRSLVQAVPNNLQEQTASFYKGILTEVLRAGHGTLAAVLSPRRRVLPKQFSDAIFLDPPMSISERVRELLERGDCQSNTQLQACGALVTGMLLSDGITVFGPDGTVRAYNVFVKHPPEKSAEKTAGGARSRTFHVLSSLVGRGLASAFMQSQDGRVEFRRKEEHG